jgi:uncharacterized protein (TIGR02611 family)
LLRRHARKAGVFVAGWVIVIVGLALVPLPGPGWAIVFVGLSLLATEFAWAARLRDRAQQWLTEWVHKLQAKRAQRRRRRHGFVDEVVADVVDEVLEDVEIAASAQSQRQQGSVNPPDGG